MKQLYIREKATLGLLHLQLKACCLQVWQDHGVKNLSIEEDYKGTLAQLASCFRAIDRLPDLSSHYVEEWNFLNFDQEAAKTEGLSSIEFWNKKAAECTFLTYGPTDGVEKEIPVDAHVIYTLYNYYHFGRAVWFKYMRAKKLHLLTQLEYSVLEDDQLISITGREWELAPIMLRPLTRKEVKQKWKKEAEEMKSQKNKERIEKLDKLQDDFFFWLQNHNGQHWQIFFK